MHSPLSEHPRAAAKAGAFCAIIFATRRADPRLRFSGNTLTMNAYEAATDPRSALPPVDKVCHTPQPTPPFDDDDEDEDDDDDRGSSGGNIDPDDDEGWSEEDDEDDDETLWTAAAARHARHRR
jgi:hypothetical protein